MQLQVHTLRNSEFCMYDGNPPGHKTPVPLCEAVRVRPAAVQYGKKNTEQPPPTCHHRSSV